MTLYVMHTGGHESSAWIVEANSEEEVLGKVSKEAGWAPTYADIDEIKDLMDEEDVAKVA